jgi:hypothetical protein
MLKTKLSMSSKSLSAVTVAVITSIWVYIISDTPVNLALSIIIGLSCGLVTYFILSAKDIHLTLKSKGKYGKQLLLLFLVLVIVMFFTSPFGSVFAADWSSIPVLNWLSFILVLIFSIFISGYIILNLLGIYKKMPFSASLVLSVLISLYFSAMFWFVIKYLTVPDNLVYVFFIASQFCLVALFFLKNSKDNDISLKRTLSLNVIIPLGAIIVIFVSLIVLQQFVYEPFVRGDSWSYVGVALTITKGGFSIASVGNFYSISLPNFFETFLSAFTTLSGFPPANSVMILSLVIAVLMPLAFYVMCLKYTKHIKISVLSTFVFVVASGFGWIPFVSQKITSSLVPYSPENLASILGNLAPKVMYDITQPQGVFSEGIKTYGLGLLAIIMVLYLFNSEFPSKVRVALIAFLMAFAFQFHIEEALIFALAFIPAYLIIIKKEKTFARLNVLGVAAGLTFALLFDLISEPILFTSITLKVSLLEISIIGLFIAVTFLKTDQVINFIKGKTLQYKWLLFIATLFVLIFSFYVLCFYGYPNLNPNYNAAVVYVGLPIPWYYYPVTLGVVGILMMIGLLMNFHEDKKVVFFLLITLFLLIFGALISLINIDLFLTGAKEWRILYRLVPIPASIFAGWVLYKLINLSSQTIKFKLPNSNHSQLRFPKHFSTIILLSVIILGIPSTIIASEYWMVSGANAYGGVTFPSSADFELANFFYHTPLTSRAVVSNYLSNAMVHLAGGVTDFADHYPNIMALKRFETIGMLSSDIRYIVVDKTEVVSEQDFPILGYMPVVFNNSRYLVYELPVMQGPTSQSSVGYIAPLRYNNLTMPSFFIISSLNTSYQIVNDDINGKSVLLLPSDIPNSQSSALKFNGVNSDITLEKIKVPLSELTVSAWFKTSASKTIMSIVNDRQSGSTQTGFRIVILDNNKVSAEINDGTDTIAVSGGEHSDNLWHNVAAVFSPKSLSLYVDGVLEGTTEITRELASIDNNLNLTIGSENGKNMFFSGFISNVCIYNRTLSDSEVRSNFSSFNNPNSNGLVLWVPLNEGVGTVIHNGDLTGVGLVRGASWSSLLLPNETNYGLDSQSMMDWVDGGGKLVVFGGEGEIYSDLGLIGSNRYSTVNSINLGSQSFQLNRTITVQSFLYPSDKVKVLGYYQFDGQNRCPFAVEQQLGEGTVIYFNLDPLYNLGSNVQGNLLFDSGFLSIITTALDNSGAGKFSITNAEMVPVNERWIANYTHYAHESFSAMGNISVNSVLSGSYLLPNPLFADNLVIDRNGIKTSYENLTIDNIFIEANAKINVNSNSIASVQCDFIPNYLPLELSNCSATLTPIGGSIKIQTDKGLFTINNGEFVNLNSTMALFLIKNPSINVNGSTTLDTLNNLIFGPQEYVGETQFHISYGEQNYLFFDSLTLPPLKTNYPQEYALPWLDILLSPFTIVLVCVMTFLAYLLKKHYVIQRLQP